MRFSESRLSAASRTVRCIGLAVLLVAPLAGAAEAEQSPVPLLESRQSGSFAAAADGRALPTDVAVAEDGRAYVVEGGLQRVAAYDAGGRRIGTFGTAGNEDQGLKDPVGIGIGPDGAVYVADRGNSRLVVFSSAGKFQSALPLQSDGGPVAPVDVAVGRNGLLYVTCSDHRVRIMDKAGGTRASWGGPGSEDGSFSYPATVAIDEDGNVYVVDVLNARVQKFDADGGFLRAFGKLGATPGSLYRPKGIAVGRDQVFVSDSYLGVVQVFDRDGRFRQVLGEAGGVRRWTTPVGLALDGRGRLLVTEMLPGSVSLTEVGGSP